MHHMQQEAAKARALQHFHRTKRAFPVPRDPAQVFVATLDSSSTSPLREPNPMFSDSSSFASGPPFADPDLFLSLEQRIENIPAQHHPKLKQILARAFEKGEAEAFQRTLSSLPLDEDLAVVCYATNMLNDLEYEPISCATNEVRSSFQFSVALDSSMCSSLPRF